MQLEVLKIERGPLLNFWVSPFWLPTPISVDFKEREREFRGVEWWYQANKVAHVGGSLDQYLEIAESKTAREAKNLGRLVEMDEDDIRTWNGFEAVKTMTEGCLAKFWQNENCANLLRETENKFLVEHRPDPIWGDNMNGTGQNLLGHILMLVRSVIRRSVIR